MKAVDGVVLVIGPGVDSDQAAFAEEPAWRPAG
jgi:hypothetical protein